MPSEIEVCARRARHAAHEMLGAVEGSACAEQLAEAMYDVHETLAILARVLELTGGWYDAHGDDLYALSGASTEPSTVARACVHELRQTAEEMRAVTARMGVVVEAAERVGSRDSLRLTAGEAAGLAAAGRTVYVVRHVSFATALSWEVGFSSDESLARRDAARLAAELPVGDVAQVAVHKPAQMLPEPALHTYPGLAEARRSAS